MAFSVSKRELLEKFFILRTDAYAIQQPSGEYTCIKRPLSPELLNGHLLGKVTLGIYLINSDNKSQLGILDIDARGPTAEEVITIIQSVAAHFGITFLLEDSGYKGFHLIAFFETMYTWKIRKLLCAIKSEAEKEVELHIPIEVFPKQDQIAEDGFGNPIKLPCGKHQVSGRISTFLDSQFQEVSDQEELFFSIVPLSEQAVDAILEKLGVSPNIPPKDNKANKHTIERSEEYNEKALSYLVEACPFVRHCRDNRAQLPEPEWHSLISLLTPFGIAGDRLSHAFSQDYKKDGNTYSEKETQDKIDRVRAAQEGNNGVGPHTCVYIKNELGFACPPDCQAQILDMASPTGLAVKLAAKKNRGAISPRVATADKPTRITFKYPWTDLGNAERMVARHGKDIRYCYERNKWLTWNGKVWEWDYGAKVLQFAKETVRSILAEAAKEKDDKKRKDLVGHARRSEAESRLNAMVNLARSEPGIAIAIQGLNADNWLFNCRNGTIDLRTGKLLPHRRQDYITIIAPVVYNPNSTSKDFDRFLSTITGADKEFEGYLQRAAGMSMTGDTSAQIMLFPYGLGENGKSTLLMALYYIMGGYAGMADPDTFMVDVKGRSGPNENLANLYGKRLVISTEVEEGRKLSVSRVKAMTGGEEMQASRKYEHEITWKPTHKVWLSGNHKPIITDTTHAIWRRVKLLPFTVTIPKDDRVDGLAEILALIAGPAILAWMVKGCLDWQRGGLHEPDAVRFATSNYRSEMDVLAPFLEDCCAVEANEDVTIKELYNTYTKYCEDNGERPMGKKKFGDRLRDKGFDQGQRSNARYWIGIRLKDNEYDR